MMGCYAEIALVLRVECYYWACIGYCYCIYEKLNILLAPSFAFVVVKPPEIGAYETPIPIGAIDELLVP